MNSDNDGSEGGGWIWHGQNSTTLEDEPISEIPESVMSQKRDHLMFDDTTTPLKACIDPPHYHSTSNGLCDEEEVVEEPYSHVKRRRVLHFESNDDIFLRSKEKIGTFEAAISEMTQWVAGFAETSDGCGDENLDPSFEGWIANCFNDNNNDSQPKDLDVQIDISGMTCENASDYDADPVEKQQQQQLPPLHHAHQNVVFKGRKSSCIRPPPKLASLITYPFTFIKPCGTDGDMTLDDINQLLVTPKPIKSQQEEEEDAAAAVCFPTSAFSGKPVVGKTKIRTEGGEGGSITIVRTRG